MLVSPCRSSDTKHFMSCSSTMAIKLYFLEPNGQPNRCGCTQLDHQFIDLFVTKKIKLLKKTLDQLSTHNIECNINITKHNLYVPHRFKTKENMNGHCQPTFLYVRKKWMDIKIMKCTRTQLLSFILIAPSLAHAHPAAQHCSFNSSP